VITGLQTTKLTLFAFTDAACPASVVK